MRARVALALVIALIGCRPSARGPSPAGGCPEGTTVEDYGDSCGRFEGCKDAQGELHGPAVDTTEGTRAEGHYEHGVPIGTWRVLDAKTGRPLGSYELDHGNGTERRWWPSGALHWEGELRLGKREGTWRYWSEEGSVTLTEEWGGGKLLRSEGSPVCPGDYPDTVDKCPDTNLESDPEDGCPEKPDGG